VLIYGAGLMGRSLATLYSVDTGVRYSDLSSFRVTFPPAASPESQSVSIAIDGVLVGLLGEATQAAAASHLPLTGANLTSSIVMEGRAEDVSTNGPSAGIRVVTPGYFALTGIPVLEGRAFSTDDSESSEDVAVINQRAAETYWPGEDPVGRWVAYAEDDDGEYIRRRIVGVVGNALFAGPSQPAVPEVYQPHSQTTEVWRWFGRSMSFVVRTQDGTTLSLRSARSILSEVDPDLPVVGLTSLDDVFRQSIGAPRFNGMLISSFAGLALVLAAVGLYGITSFTVRRRWRELGVRKALGADSATIVREVLTRSLGAALIGTAAGLCGALIVGGVLDEMVFGISVRDPATIGGALSVLVPVALIASWLPAMSAARVDPVEALGAE
jgi:putative ABC transport system permease protein